MTEQEKFDMAAPPDTISRTSTLHEDMSEKPEKANHNGDSQSAHSNQNEVDENDLKGEAEGATAIAATRTRSEPEYISGMKLYSLLAAQTLVFFLVMIDMSIVATVSL